MTVKKGTRAAKPAAPAVPTARQAWREVLARMGDLGDAMTQWTKAAAHKDDAKQKLEQIRAGISDMAQKADAAFGHVDSSELGEQVRASAEQVGGVFGEAAQSVREATAPHVRDAFAEFSDVFRQAAEKMAEPKPPASKPSPPSAKPKA